MELFNVEDAPRLVFEVEHRNHEVEFAFGFRFARDAGAAIRLCELLKIGSDTARRMKARVFFDISNKWRKRAVLVAKVEEP
ncbi:hypothetical protein D3C78_1902020 [compost metagenome]